MAELYDCGFEVSGKRPLDIDAEVQRQQEFYETVLSQAERMLTQVKPIFDEAGLGRIVEAAEKITKEL